MTSYCYNSTSANWGRTRVNLPVNFYIWVVYCFLESFIFNFYNLLVTFKTSLQLLVLVNSSRAPNSKIDTELDTGAKISYI